MVLSKMLLVPLLALVTLLPSVFVDGSLLVDEVVPRLVNGDGDLPAVDVDGGNETGGGDVVLVVTDDEAIANSGAITCKGGIRNPSASVIARMSVSMFVFANLGYN